MSEIHDAGRLEDHPFAELAGLIFRENRTGELTLESGQRRRSVWFLGGNPVAVLSADPRDHLAQFLLEHGRVSPEDAERLAGLPETREALGTADFLPKETLTWGVKSRFVNLCYDLFRWEEGDYAFRNGDPPRELFLLKVPAHSLILKGVGFVSNATVREAVPDDAVCGPGPVPAGDTHHLGPEAQRLLAECGPDRGVAEAVGDGSDDPDQARRTIYALRCLGLLTVTPGVPAPAATPEPASAPVFAFDDGFGQVDEPGPAGAAEAAESADRLALEEEPAAAGQDFSLPPLDDTGPGLGDTSAIDFPPGTPPPGGYPFENEPSAGAFGSFGSDLTPDRQAEPQAGGGTPPEHTKNGGTKPAAARFRLPGVPKIAGIVLGGIVAAALIGGAAWWWMGGGGPQPTAVRPPTKQPAPTPLPPAPAPPAETSTAPAAQPAVPADAPPSGGTPAAPAVPPAAPPAPAATEAPAAPQAVDAAPAPAAAGADRYRNALEVFKAGDLDGAAAIWESLLSDEHRDSFTLLLLTACQPETIRDAQRTLSSQQLFLVSKKVNGRDCFRVCAGTFPSRDAAARTLAGLPAEFRSAGASVKPVTDVLKRDR